MSLQFLQCTSCRVSGYFAGCIQAPWECASGREDVSDGLAQECSCNPAWQGVLLTTLGCGKLALSASDGFDEMYEQCHAVHSASLC